jgi:3'-5' exoribonuclease
MSAYIVPSRAAINPADFSTDWTATQVGQQIADEVFCVQEISAPKEDKNGNLYRDIILSNCYEQRIKTKAWADTQHEWNGVQAGMPVQINGRVERGFPDPAVNALKYVSGLTVVEGPHPVLSFMNPVYPGDPQALVDEFEAMIQELGDPWKTFVTRFFETACKREKFFTAPAAKGHHHAYIHGLLDHTLEVTRFARGAADNPATRAHVNRDLVIAGALIHDAGKIHEYVWDNVPIGMSEDALLFNHMLTGPMMVTKTYSVHHEELSRIGFTYEMAKHLMHIQASHHGQQEWGAVVPPATPAAVIIHNADLMSAKLRAMTEFISGQEPSRTGRIEGAKWGVFRHGVICDPGTFGPDRTVEVPALFPDALPDEVVREEKEAPEVSEARAVVAGELGASYAGPLAEKIGRKREAAQASAPAQRSGARAR